MLNKFNVEIAYANEQQQIVINIQLLPGCTVEAAIQQSGVLKKFPEINLKTNKIGIFSKCVSLSTLVQAGDRIEIYRELLIDPKQARKQRAQRQTKE